MKKAIEQQIFNQFQTDESKVDAKEYSDKIFDSWKDTSASPNRNSLLILLFIAAFELLSYQPSSATVSVGLFSVANAPVIQIAIPAIVAFLLYDSFLLNMRWVHLRLIHGALINVWTHGPRNDYLNYLVQPSLPSFWAFFSGTGYGVLASENFSITTRIATSSIIVLITPIAFECQAYLRLFDRYGYGDILIWVTAVVTMFFLVCAYIYWMLAFRETD